MFLYNFRTALRAGALCLSAVAFGVCADVSRPVVIDRAAREVAQPEQSFLLGAAHAGSRLVAVGESGLVILSDSDGKTWRQAEVPTSVMLTDVGFANERAGWAIGHLGVVLRTEDGGETWTRQLDGIAAANLVLEAVRARVAQADDDSSQMALRQAEYLVEDGPDKPFLAVRVESPERALILGAYGYALRTEDGGRTWATVANSFDNPMGLHYYDIACAGRTSLVVGEQGMALRARPDGGYEQIQQPYEGSLFGVEAPDGDSFVAFGLRGNVVHSADQGDNWTEVDSGVSASIQAGTVLRDGAVLLAAENGQMITSRDGGRHFKLLQQRAQPAADILQISDSNVLVVGPRGAQVVDLAVR